MRRMRTCEASCESHTVVHRIIFEGNQTPTRIQVSSAAVPNVHVPVCMCACPHHRPPARWALVGCPHRLVIVVGHVAVMSAEHGRVLRRGEAPTGTKLALRAVAPPSPGGTHRLAPAGHATSAAGYSALPHSRPSPVSTHVVDVLQQERPGAPGVA